MEAGGSGIQKHSWLRSKFEASLGKRRRRFKTNKQKEATKPNQTNPQCRLEHAGLRGSMLGGRTSMPPMEVLNVWVLPSTDRCCLPSRESLLHQPLFMLHDLNFLGNGSRSPPCSFQSGWEGQVPWPAAQSRAKSRANRSLSHMAASLSARSRALEPLQQELAELTGSGCDFQSSPALPYLAQA